MAKSEMQATASGSGKVPWRMVWRCITALIGSYAAASAASSLMARLLPVSRPEATAWGMIASFPIFSCLGLWSFHEARLARVAGVIWGVAAFGAGLVLLGPRP